MTASNFLVIYFYTSLAAFAVFIAIIGDQKKQIMKEKRKNALMYRFCHTMQLKNSWLSKRRNEGE